MSLLYGMEYYQKMLQLNSRNAETICDIRWGFINSIAPEKVLDFGSGIGYFAAFAPDGMKVDTHEIGPAPSSGIRRAHYDLVTLWDVFEHIEDFSFLKEVLKMTDYVALSVPVLPEGTNLFTWKHFKPGEHLYQFTSESLDAIFKDWGFERIKKGTPEVDCGIREDIYSVIYEKTDL